MKERKTLVDLEDSFDGMVHINTEIHLRNELYTYTNGNTKEIEVHQSEYGSGLKWDDSNAILPFSTDITLLDDYEEKNIGKMLGMIIFYNPSKCDKDDRINIIDVCDSIDGDLYELASLAMTNNKYMKNKQEFFIYIYDITIEEQYRRYTLAEIVLKNIPYILERQLHLKSGNLFFCACPLETKKHSEEELENKVNHLKEIFMNYGFKEIENNHMMYEYSAKKMKTKI